MDKCNEFDVLDSDLVVELKETKIPNVIKNFPIATSIQDLKEPMNIEKVKLNFSKHLPESIVQKPFRRSLLVEEKIEESMQDLELAGILTRYWSPNAFEVVRVGKKDGTLRDSFDLRLINKYMLPNIILW
jgi:hypothetical protein